MHTNLLHVRPIATSLITKNTFNSGFFVTPKRKVSFFDWNKQENDGLLNSKELEHYDHVVKNYGKDWGCVKDVKLNCNVTNYDYDNKIHFISILCHYINTDHKIVYCIDKRCSQTSKVLSTLEFKTVKGCKAYIKTNEHKL